MQSPSVTAATSGICLRTCVRRQLRLSHTCKSCWDPDHPQLQLGMYPVNDPQAVREPRPDVSYYQSGTTGLQELLTDSTSQQGIGYPSDGSRIIQWNWNPVGGPRLDDNGLTPNTLLGQGQLGTVTVTTS